MKRCLNRHSSLVTRHRALLLVALALVASWACAQEKPADPLVDSPYRLRLHVAEGQLADFTGMGQVEVNLGPAAQKDLGDVRILDDKGREQPWYLRSQSASGDARIVFRTIRGMHDYDLVFGLAGRERPNYGERFGIGRVVIDDFLEEAAHTHGLWLWVTHPTVSGAFAHTSPLLDRVGFHGTSEIGSPPIYEGTTVNQYVMIDKEHPPEKILLQFSFAQRPNEGDWERKNYLLLTWGKGRISGLSGRTLHMGDLPEPGKWHRLSLDLGQLAGKAGIIRSRDGTLYLYGLGFATDKGRAYWDMTTIGDLPGRVDVTGLSRKDATAKPTFVYQRDHVFTLDETKRVLSEVRFFPTAGDAACSWDFGDGATSTETDPVHVFDAGSRAKVTLELSPAGGTVTQEVQLPETSRTRRDFAIDLAACPFIVRADQRALFNLRLESDLRESMPVDVQAVMLDATDREIARERAAVTMYPGKKHPVFQAFSLDVSAPELARVRFEMSFHGRPLAGSEVMLRSSTAEMDRVRLAGDRFVDAFDRPVVIRAELTEAPPERSLTSLRTGKPRQRTRLPRNTLIIGTLRMPGETLLERYKRALQTAPERPPETEVDVAGVETLPAWSLPYRQVLAMKDVPLAPVTEVVLIASAERMLLEGVPARAAVDAIGVMVDNVRRRSNAEVFILTPTVHSGLEDVSRQYAVTLRKLGIEKNVEVIDLYSRALRLASAEPDVLKTAHVADGVLTHQLHPDVAQMIVDAILDRLLHKVRIISE